MNQIQIATAFAILSLTAVPSFAVNHAGSTPEPIKTAQAPGSLTDGEIRKVDKDAKKITIKHAPIQNLDMPAMTMVFQVKDTSVLDRLKTGDKVKFAAENNGGAYIVTHIEPAK